MPDAHAICVCVHQQRKSGCHPNRQIQTGPAYFGEHHSLVPEIQLEHLLQPISTGYISAACVSATPFSQCVNPHQVRCTAYLLCPSSGSPEPSGTDTQDSYIWRMPTAVVNDYVIIAGTPLPREPAVYRTAPWWTQTTGGECRTADRGAKPDRSRNKADTYPVEIGG